MFKLRNFRFHKLKVLWQNVKNSREPIKMLLAYLLVFSGFHRFITLNQGVYRIHFSRSSLALAFFMDSTGRHADEDFLRRTLKEGDTFVDIGSNIGTLTLLGSVLCNKGKVISIEAHPETFAFLEKNILLNKFNNIETFNCAVGKEDGYVFFTDAGADDLNKVTIKSKGIKVPAKKIDSIIAEKNISLMKIDVEGFEKFVLEGAQNTMKKTDIVYFESFENHFLSYNYSTSDLLLFFKNHGFKVYKVNGDQLEELNDNYISIMLENLVAIRHIDNFIIKTGYKLKLCEEKCSQKEALQ